MDVAFHPDHYLGLDELAVEGRLAGALTVVPFAIHLGERVNVMRYWIRVGNR